MPKSPNDRPYPVLDLFAGIGGFTLAFEAVEYANRLGLAGRDAPIGEGYRRRMGTAPAGSSAFRTIAFSEIDPYASAVLAHRFPAVPNLGPVQHVTRDSVLTRCGELPLVVTGGFPCQPHSLAGKRGSVIDPRDLWDECVRVLRDIRPRFALFENVAGLLTSGSYTDAADGELGAGLFLNRVCSDLAAIRYACQWQVVSAADVGAPHRRDRVWLLCVDELGLADRESKRVQGRRPRGEQESRAYAGAGLPLGGGESSGSGRDWPAAHGLWPARPGQRQHGWEPSRVVGDAAARRLPLAESESGSAGNVGEREGGTASAIGTRPAGADGRQAEPLVGRDADGLSDFVDAAADEVREAEGGEVMWRTPTADEAGARIETLFTKDGQPARPGERAYRLQPDGRLVLQSQTIGQQVEMVERVERSGGTADPSDAVNRVPRLKALGNAIVPAVAHIFALAIYEQLVAMDGDVEVAA